MNVCLRACESSDFENLYQIDQACFPPGIAYSRRTLSSFLRLPGANCLVATCGHAIVGFILTCVEGREGHIITLDVLRAHRRQGTGSLLLTAAEKDLRQRGADYLTLETATDNDVAIAFWRKHGYVPYGVVRGYYGRGRDAHVMYKHFGHAKETNPA